jgi:hypothetical protein
LDHDSDTNTYLFVDQLLDVGTVDAISNDNNNSRQHSGYDQLLDLASSDDNCLDTRTATREYNMYV